jgi:alanine dehydrogenase
MSVYYCLKSLDAIACRRGAEVEMRIGVPREIKVHEYRVGMVPAGVRELVAAGHEVLVETRAGAGIGFADADYQGAGARIARSAAEVFAAADLLVKVKEPQRGECAMLRPGQVLFTFLHLAADLDQARALCDSGATAIAYETVTAPDGSLPILTPMSEVAGRMSVQVGASCLQKASGGRGLLLGGVPGVEPAKVVILGGGVAGSHAIEMAVGMRADVTVVERSVPRLRDLSARFGAALEAAYSTTERIESLVLGADLVIARSDLGRGAQAGLPRAGAEDEGRRRDGGHLDRPGGLLRDQPADHARRPDLYGRRHRALLRCQHAGRGAAASAALGNVTLHYVRTLADLGWEAALAADPHLARGLNVHAGHITHPVVAHALRLEFRSYPVAA